MKKVLSVIMIIALLFCFAACGNGNETDEPTYTLKLAHVEAEDRSTNDACLLFKDAVEEATNGDIKVEIFPNAVLGGDEELTESVALGEIQMALPSSSVLTMYAEQFGILDMPFLFTSSQAAFNALDGELGETLNTYLEGTGIINLGWAYNGPRSFTNNVRPINTVDDLKGLKIRVMSSPVCIDMVETLGASATPISFSELYTALEQGTVEGEENPPTLIYASGFHEVQKYLSLDQHQHNFLPIATNEEWFNSLPEDYQKIVSENAKTYLVDKQREIELQDNVDIRKTLEDAGMIVNDITPEAQQGFIDKVQPMYEKYYEKFGKDMFDLALSFN